MTSTVSPARTRDVGIDNLRGLAILLVLVGHLVQQWDSHFDAHPLFRWIYSFHMPLFMFLSGWVWTFNPNFAGFLRSRLLTLALPFWLWGLMLRTDPLTLLQHPDNGLWFLWLLFIIQLLVWGLVRLHPRLIWVFLVLAIAPLPAGYTWVGFQGVFFVLGYRIASRGLPTIGHWKWLLLTCQVMLAVFLWHRSTPFYTFVSYSHLPQFSQTLFRYAMAALGIFTLWQFKDMDTPVIAYLGRQSGNFYASHQTVLGWMVALPFGYAFAACLIGTVGLNWVWQRLPLVNYALPTKARFPWAKAL